MTISSTSSVLSPSPRSILTPSLSSSSLLEESSPRSDRNGNEIVRRSKAHSISFADEVTDRSGSRQSLEFVHSVECYKDLNRLHSFGLRGTKFPRKKQSCFSDFKKFLCLVLTASASPVDHCHGGYRTSIYYA